MCGIVGGISTQEGRGLTGVVRQAADALRHRGPDDEGFLVFCGSTGSVTGINVPVNAAFSSGIGTGRVASTVVLGHRRLSIIDLSVTARQPMTFGDSGLFLSFNGEIYNYRELRAELVSQGAEFRTSSDTEVLLAAWRQWGPACLGRFVGMFAFALLDVPARKLFLARDPFGIKPLFYARTPNALFFSSEIPPLLDMPGVSRRANSQRIFDFLNEGIADYAGESFFEGISQVPAAHYAEISLDSPADIVQHRYWDLDLARQANLSFSEAASRLRELFLESVSLHLRSDVPLGIALSGGLDSSAVIAAARRSIGDSGELHSFSYIAEDPAICEERWVDDANRAAQAIPHKIHIGMKDIVRDFDQLVALQGEPVPSPVVYAQWRVFQECQKTGVKVLLEGQGSDELLAGYPFYPPAHLAGLLRNGRLAEGLGFAHAVAGSRRAQARMIKSAVVDFGRKSRGVFPWIDDRWVHERAIVTSRIPAPGGRSLLRNALYETLSTSTIPKFLRWGDRNAMSCSIENRVPFLTPQIAQFLFTLPGEYLLARDGTTKAVFREAMKGLVPDSILDRRDKIGFTTPYRYWLRAMQPRCADLLQEAERIPALDHDRVRRDCSGYLAGAEAPPAVVHHLWGVLFLSAWARQFDVSFS